jgi:hypothetical protein
MEENLGIHGGHRDARAIVETWLTEVEGPE